MAEMFPFLATLWVWEIALSLKVSNAKGHPLLSIMPRVKPSSYNLRKETCFKPKINTMRFKNSFINRLVFKYELAM